MASLQKTNSLSMNPSSQIQDSNLFCSPWDSGSNAQYASMQFMNFLDLNLKYPNELYKPGLIEDPSEIPGIESYIQSLRKTKDVSLESPLSIDQQNAEIIHHPVKNFKKKKYQSSSQSRDLRKKVSAHEIYSIEDADTNTTSPAITIDNKETDPTFLTLSKSFKKDLSPTESQSRTTFSKIQKLHRNRPQTGVPTREASRSQRSLNYRKGSLNKETSSSHMMETKQFGENESDLEKKSSIHAPNIKLLLRSRTNETNNGNPGDHRVHGEEPKTSTSQQGSFVKINKFNEIPFPENKEKLRRALSNKVVPSHHQLKKSPNTTLTEVKSPTKKNSIISTTSESNLLTMKNMNPIVAGFVRQHPSQNVKKKGEMRIEDYLSTILETSTNCQKDIVKSIEFSNHIWMKHKNEYACQAPLLKNLKKQIEGKSLLNNSRRADTPDSKAMNRAKAGSFFMNKRPSTSKPNTRGVSINNSPSSKFSADLSPSLDLNEHYIKSLYKNNIAGRDMIDKSLSRSNMDVSRFQRPATALRNDRLEESLWSKNESISHIKEKIIKKGTSESVLWALKTNLLKRFPNTPETGKDRVVVTFKRK